ncbi:family 78 glycoside hydrolase catalytic domain [Ancylomarina longa]|uniref:Glycogen debranching protein n=1 Tax=Ancylomarina longa TaxID=2487017 RepID=A0A434AZH4_9BACT|nr:family 78 glycoside hydrolase catalytic domain [Ancylomarina longa]RUT79934.1 glycogen debranching protein [Ancylomarina longa]
MIKIKPSATIILLLFLLSYTLQSCDQNDTPLYSSAEYSIYPNRVIQGKYTALAKDSIHITTNYPIGSSKKKKSWTLQTDLSPLPSYHSNQVLLNAIYNLSLEELEKNIAPDTTFNTGEKWQGVWTRDISYSTILALAITHPEIAMNSLLRKVKHGKIIQDTGTGGSWPISSDRMIWSTAAWEIYKTTGDPDWLRRVYFLIKNSTEDDLNVVWDYQQHLFKGESSFLDWREQSYPKWMEPKDIYNSFDLSTQAVHYQSLQVLIRMGYILGKDVQKYEHISKALKSSINEKFWMPEKQYYGQFLYGEKHHVLSRKSESLGEALMILWGIADKDKSTKIIRNCPVTAFGIPCFYPQIPDIPAYHNQAIWPFVQAYWNWAAAKTKNMESLEWGLASIFRSSALFLTNKENFRITDGDFNGTAINSNRQLWSVAGTLSAYYHCLLGLNFTAGRLEFRPFIPRAYKGIQHLKGLHYRSTILDIDIYGFGDKILSYSVDGVPYKNPIIPKDLEGYHQVKIMMNNQMPAESKINIVANAVAPRTPDLSYSENQLRWNKIKDADHYNIYQNGNLLLETSDNYMADVQINETVEFAVQAVDTLGYQSFTNKPILLNQSRFHRFLEAESFLPKTKSKTANSYAELSKKQNQEYLFKIKAPRDGDYWIDFLYANGNGPINTDNKCGLRSFWVNDSYVGSIVFPQRGKDNWTDYGYTNTFEISIPKGNNYFRISFEDFNENMNGEVNSVRIDKIRLIRKR